MTMLQQERRYDVWTSTLRRIYSEPASITIITGFWKTGKTNFGLHLLEELKDMKLFHELASNVKTEGEYNIKHINDMLSLDKWTFRTRYRKGYLYDEAIESTPSRRAMSRLNTGWLRFIPQLSKGKLHVIVVTQETDYTESSFLHGTFIRAVWEKLNLPKHHPQYRKMVRLYSTLIRELRIFKGLPKCITKYDPYEPATFHLEPDIAMLKVSDDVQLAFDYVGMSSGELVNKYDWLHSRKEALRRVRLGIRALKQCYLVQNSGEGYNEERKVTIPKS